MTAVDKLIRRIYVDVVVWFILIVYFMLECGALGTFYNQLIDCEMIGADVASISPTGTVNIVFTG